MAVTTEVGDNLLIAESTADTTKSNDSAFKTYYHQAITGKLNPVSTINAADDHFFYTYDALADGSKFQNTTVEPYKQVYYTGQTGASDANIAKVSADGGTSYAYDAYKDYVFELKAVNANTSTQYLNLTRLNLLYNGSPVTEHGYRVAIFTQALNGAGNAYVAREVTTAANNIFATSGYVYFNNTAVSTTTAKAAVSPAVNNAGWSQTLAGGSTNYYKVTVRLWLEGEDTDCYNAKYVTLDEAWQLDLKFDIESSASGAVALIGSDASALITQSATVASVTLTSEAIANGETASTYAWYNRVANGDDTLISGATGSTYDGDAGATVYCVITTSKGNVYRTPVITLAD